MYGADDTSSKATLPHVPDSTACGRIKAISRVYVVATDIQDAFDTCEDAVKPVKGILLAAGLQHIDSRMSLEKDAGEDTLQASRLVRDDWSRTLEWPYRDV